MKRNIYSRFIAAAALLFQTAAAFPVSAEDIAPNLNSATVSFSEKTACYLYTGKQITPAFSVYLANDIQLPASKYSWTVISKDGDGTSAGTEPGTVKIEIAGTPESGLPGKCTVSYQIVRPGDCNCDGVLDASDADMMQKWLFNSEQISFWKAGDLNRDGRLNAVDLTMLKRSILNSHERTEVSMKITGKSAETLPDGFAEKFQSAVKTMNSKLDFSDFTFEAHGMKLIEKSTPAPI